MMSQAKQGHRTTKKKEEGKRKICFDEFLIGRILKLESLERFNFSTHRICVCVYGVDSVCVFGGELVNIKTQSSQAGLRDFKSLRTHLPHRSSRVSPWRRVGFFKKNVSLSGYTLEFSSHGNTLGMPRSCSPPFLTLPLGLLQLLLLSASLPFLWARGTVVSGKQWPNQGSFLENPARRKTTAKWNCPDALMRSSRMSLECDRGTLPPSAMGETVPIATTGFSSDDCTSFLISWRKMPGPLCGRPPRAELAQEAKGLVWWFCY